MLRLPPLERWAKEMRFSEKAFWVMTTFHGLVTVFVALSALGSAMGASPMHNPTNDLKFAEKFFWVWQTGPAVLYHVFEVKGFIILAMAFTWSLLVGSAAGAFFGLRQPKPPNTAAQTTAPPSSGL